MLTVDSIVRPDHCNGKSELLSIGQRLVQDLRKRPMDRPIIFKVEQNIRSTLHRFITQRNEMGDSKRKEEQKCYVRTYNHDPATWDDLGKPG